MPETGFKFGITRMNGSLAGLDHNIIPCLTKISEPEYLPYKPAISVTYHTVAHLFGNNRSDPVT